MKIVTWNCQQAFMRKAGRIFSNLPDIAVIQECSEKSTEMLGLDGYTDQWIGDNSNKGLAVFCRRDWDLHALAGSNEEIPKWIVPFAVRGRMDFTLTAGVGAKHQGQPARKLCRSDTQSAEREAGMVSRGSCRHGRGFQ